MIVKRKLYSVMDEEGNQGYYLYNEATGEERLFSVVEEEREFASVRDFKKATNTLIRSGFNGKATTKDVSRLMRIKGINSMKTATNPNFEKIAKGAYNSVDKMSKGRLAELGSAGKRGFIDGYRETATQIREFVPKKLNKGDIKNTVKGVNSFKKMV